MAVEFIPYTPVLFVHLLTDVVITDICYRGTQYFLCGTVTDNLKPYLYTGEHYCHRHPRKPLIVHNVRVSSVLLVDGLNCTAPQYEPVEVCGWTWFPSSECHCHKVIQSMASSYSPCSPTTHCPVL